MSFLYLPADPTTVIMSATEYAQQGLELGAVYSNRYGELFRFVKNAGADTSVQYKLATWLTGGARGSATMTDATSTDGTLGTVTRICGIWQAAIPTLYYGFLLVVSDYTNVYTDDGVVDGDYLVMDGGATHTFIADTAVAGEEHAVFGQARAADNDTTHLVLAAVNCL